MNTLSRASALLLALVAASLPGAVPAQAMVMANTIVVSNTGSTNFIGYRVLIAPGGQVSYVSGDGPGNSVLPRPLLRRLKRDVAAASPLSRLPEAAACMKPMSFGTSTFVALGGERSPDLTCPANRAARALKNDVAKVVAFLRIRNVLQTQGTALPPQNF